MNSRGIVTVIGLVIFVILLILFGMVFVPLWYSLIAPSAYSALNGSVIGLMMFKLIPAFFLLGITIAWLIYASAVR